MGRGIVPIGGAIGLTRGAIELADDGRGSAEVGGATGRGVFADNVVAGTAGELVEGDWADDAVVPAVVGRGDRETGSVAGGPVGFRSEGCGCEGWGAVSWAGAFF